MHIFFATKFDASFVPDNSRVLLERIRIHHEERWFEGSLPFEGIERVPFDPILHREQWTDIVVPLPEGSQYRYEVWSRRKHGYSAYRFHVFAERPAFEVFELLKPIVYKDFPHRTATVLHHGRFLSWKQGVHYNWELATLSWEGLRRVRSCGKTVRQHFKEYLELRGLRLEMPMAHEIKAFFREETEQ